MDIDKMVEKVAEAVSAYGPKVGELALTLGQIGAIQHIAFGMVLFCGFLCFTVLSILFYRKYCKCLSIYNGYFHTDGNPQTSSYAEAKKADDFGDVWFVGAAVFVVPSALFFVFSMIQLSNIYAWAGLWRPEVYLAAKALGWL